MHSYIPNKRRLFFGFAAWFLLLPVLALGQADKRQHAPALPPPPEAGLQFLEAGNRYGHQVKFEAALPSGKLFLHPNKFTYAFQEVHDHNHGAASANPAKNTHALKAHAYTVTFEGANSQTPISGQNQRPGRYNFFRGNDPGKWGTGLRAFAEVEYQELYPGINMRLLEQNQHLKYEFVLQPGANPAQIKMRYSGAEKLQLKNQQLVITTSVNQVTETRPYAYQVLNGEETEVACRFVLTGNLVSFELPNGYDASLPLVIDPELIYSTFSGSAANNWGFTATYDSLGNIYSGGVVFGVGFPVTPGAYDPTFNGDYTDIAILKFNPSQTGAASLEYATYLGGNSTEAPHSLVVNSANELLIYGTTGSNNYPVSASAYKPNFTGGPSATSILQTGINASHPNGVDLIISKLSADGSTLLASTYLGGSDTDGLLMFGDPLVKNYGDQSRGDIITDNTNNVYITASSVSLDFPVVNGFQGSHGGGGLDAVVCKLSPDLNSLVWSSYLGGSGRDAAYSIQLDSVNNVVVAGGTTSSNFPTSANSYSPNYNQNIDGFVARISASGNTLQRSTYLGTTSYDQVYFVQLDQAGNVYVLGQSMGNYPVSPGVYANPNSKQFIQKLDPELTTSLFSTVFGSGNGQINISPTAFLVNRCNTIYAAGWGGATNAGYSGGSTNNMPITPDATQTQTDGSDFYIIALANDASSLILGTYMGGIGINEHVDGGTSRFDKNSADGIVYQAVCAGCWGSSNFPTTPGAYSAQNGSSLCNNAVFKYQIPELAADFTPSLTLNGPYENEACAPATFFFRKDGVGGVSFVWDFGDGQSTVSPGPVQHTYPNPGSYVVSLTATDSATCDISVIVIDTVVVHAVTGTAGPDLVRCDPDVVQLQASGGISYLWSPGASLTDSTAANPHAFPGTTTTYQVTITNAGGCQKTDSVTVTVVPQLSVSQGATICAGNTAHISASAGFASYSWFPTHGLSDSTIANPTAQPDSTTTYTVVVTGANGACSYTGFITVQVQGFAGLAVTGPAAICAGDSVLLEATAAPGFSMSWWPTVGLSDSTSGTVMASPAQTTLYTVTAAGALCTSTDTVRVTVNALPLALAGPDAGLCETQTIAIGFPGQPDVSYHWSPAATVTDSAIANPVAFPAATTTYTLTATTAAGCTSTDFATLTVSPAPDVLMPPADTICAGQAVVLPVQADPQLGYLWSHGITLSDSTVMAPVASPGATTTYTLQVTSGGCTTMHNLTLHVLPAAVAIAPPDVQLCKGQTLTLSASEFPNTTYSWWPDAGLSAATSAVTTATPQEPTTYYLQATNQFGCPALDSVQVSFYGAPLLAATPEEPYGVQPLPVQFTNLSTGGGTYTWDFGNGQTATGAVPPAIEYPIAGTYTVTLTTVYGPGCEFSDTVAVVRVVPPMVPNIITPNGDGFNDTFEAILTNLPLHIRIYNRWGKLMYEHSNYQQDWGAPNAPEGLYYYELDAPDGRNWKGWLEVVK